MRRFRSKPYDAPPFIPVRAADPADAHTLAVPGYRQTRGYTCGFVAVLAVVRYWDVPIGARELYARLGTDRTGTRQAALIRVLRDLRVRANVRYDLTFRSLCAALDAHKLVIGYLNDAEHWIVFYGYGAAPERVFVLDSRPGQQCVYPWAIYGPRCGGFGIVCSPRPPVARPRAEPEQKPPRVPAQLSLPFGEL